MRKPQPVKGQYIPRNKTNSPQSNTNKQPEVDVGEMLGKLNGEQLAQLGSGVIELANNGVDLAKEYLRTGQVFAQTQAEIKKNEAEVKKVALQEETKQKEITQRGKDNELSYYSDTSKEANSHEQIMKILDQVESGQVPSEQLSELILSVKSGS
ncbi:hypothetical protein [Shewanella sp. 10N.286.48.B5]|uniref:hypothetical protein n=1 Tax=Shewanella sp. 10N.286.48.B5 TaxID=1880834 RepID=UPI000C81732C|nr:hypothetical protein [Shewanella sp. 10N.286.48.B5]PMH85653.1 hypothetical protein BCU57_13600 [Shewanella sp. 10N.286.48.B5]